MAGLLDQLTATLAPHCRIRQDSIHVSRNGINALACLATPIGRNDVRPRHPKQASRIGWAQHLVEPGWYSIEAVPLFLQRSHILFPHSELDNLREGIGQNMIVDVGSSEEDETAAAGANAATAAEMALREELALSNRQVQRLKRSNARYQAVARNAKSISTSRSDFFFRPQTKISIHSRWFLARVAATYRWHICQQVGPGSQH